MWERGAGPTLACGTGACAAMVAAVRDGRCNSSNGVNKMTVSLPGGCLLVEWAGAVSSHVMMTGPAVAVFEGSLLLPLHALPASA